MCGETLAGKGLGRGNGLLEGLLLRLTARPSSRLSLRQPIRGVGGLAVAPVTDLSSSGAFFQQKRPAVSVLGDFFFLFPAPGWKCPEGYKRRSGGKICLRGLPGGASAKGAGMSWETLQCSASTRPLSVAPERRVFLFCASFGLPAISSISLCVSSFSGPLKGDCWPSQALVEVGGAEAYY